MRDAHSPTLAFDKRVGGQGMVRTGISRLRPIMSHPHNHAGTIANNDKKGQSWDDWPKLGNVGGLSRNYVSPHHNHKRCRGPCHQDPMRAFVRNSPSDSARLVFVTPVQTRHVLLVGKNPCVFFTACAVTFFIRHVSSPLFGIFLRTRTRNLPT